MHYTCKRKLKMSTKYSQNGCMHELISRCHDTSNNGESILLAIFIRIAKKKLNNNIVLQDM